MNGDFVVWLLSLILFVDNGGDWDIYFESVY